MTITGAVGIMGVRVWALLLATVRGTYWREGLRGTYWRQGLENYVLETGLEELRTGDWVWRGRYWRQGLER